MACNFVIVEKSSRRAAEGPPPSFFLHFLVSAHLSILSRRSHYSDRLLGTALILLSFLNSMSAMAITGGSPSAIKGGQFTVGVSAYPKSLIYYLSHDVLSVAMDSLVLETLLGTDVQTNDFIPSLAKSWVISKDNRTFTFTLDPKAKFSDGKPVTAEDVKFTWDTLLNPKNKTAPFQSYYSSIASIEIKDNTVTFQAKTLHFKNFEKVAGLFVFPKHIYSQGDFNKSFHQKLIGSGPYKLEGVEQNKKVSFRRDSSYWANDRTDNIGKFNFEKIVFKVTGDPIVGYEIFKKGDTDLQLFNIAKVWMTETQIEIFQKQRVVKMELENKIPSGNQGIFWNMRKPLLSDLGVRTALSMLMNRKRWIETLFYGLYQPSLGILNLNSEYRSLRNKMVEFDPPQAKELLKAAGWTLSEDGLKKGNLKFEFDVLTNSPATSRYLTLYQEDLKKMGIVMNIRIQDWPAFLKLIDDRQFDAVVLARTAGIDPSDFATPWGSAEADKKGSSNIAGLKNSEVDVLAQKIDETFSKRDRLPLVQRIDEIITAEHPYALTWESKATRMAHWNRFSYPGKGYFDYSDWWNMYWYWWVDPAKEAKLKAGG